MSEVSFDAIVIGAGMAGMPLALKLGLKGKKVALIERDDLGGTCLNRGCIPTKTLIASARVAHQARHAGTWGVHASDVRTDLGAVVDRKDQLVRGIRAGARRNVGRNEHVTLLRGHARFVAPRTLEVDGQRLHGEHVFINTGTRPHLPAIGGLANVPFLDSTSALELRELPGHLLVVGGGYVGVEYAQMYSRFGSRVTLIQRAPHLLPEEDEDIARALEDALVREGIEVRTSTTALRTAAGSDHVTLDVLRDGHEERLEGTHLLLATGRTPNTDDLDLERAGVEVDERGFVRVNDRLETSAEGVWALGDVRGGLMFTHTARGDARIVYENLTKDAGLSVAGRVVPYAVFSEPQLGRVGLNERQARAAGYDL